eukprot:COSAG01_NODE_2089_length_8454_cov_12.054339_7_plen_72_part_00
MTLPSIVPRPEAKRTVIMPRDIELALKRLRCPRRRLRLPRSNAARLLACFTRPYWSCHIGHDATSVAYNYF